MAPTLVLFVLLAFVASSHTTSRGKGNPIEEPGRSAPPATSCDVTTPVREKPPQQAGAGPLGKGPWYVNDDRSIWVRARTWQARKGEKLIWVRPSGENLTVTGRRLDGPTGALKLTAPCCYPWGFQVTGLMFPTEGCWEVTAKTGKSELVFVVQVRPADDATAPTAQPNKFVGRERSQRACHP